MYSRGGRAAADTKLLVKRRWSEHPIRYINNSDSGYPPEAKVVASRQTDSSSTAAELASNDARAERTPTEPGSGRHCEWCSRAIRRAPDGLSWLAVKGVERDYDPKMCGASDDGLHEPAKAPVGTATAEDVDSSARRRGRGGPGVRDRTARPLVTVDATDVALVAFLAGVVAAAVHRCGGQVVEADADAGAVLVQVGDRRFQVTVAPVVAADLPPLERKTGP